MSHKSVSKVEIRDAKRHARNVHIGDDGRTEKNKIFDCLPELFGVSTWNQQEQLEDDTKYAVWLRDDKQMAVRMKRYGGGWMCEKLGTNVKTEEKSFGFMEKKAAEAQIIEWMCNNEGDK